MCACRQKKSFLIEDILSDTIKKTPYRNLSKEPTKPLYCREPRLEVNNEDIERNYARETKTDTLTKLNVVSEVQHEIGVNEVKLEARRNTYPLYPTAVKAGCPWSYRGKEPVYLDPRFTYYSDPVLNNSLMRSQLVANRFVSHPLTMRQAYGFDRVGANCCTGWLGAGGRRKGGQVRFTAAQTGALERRFGASKYLSPEERRALANTLRLNDRQVKTWFQNRRAKWRRTTPDSCDTSSPPASPPVSPPASSPASGSEDSDTEVHPRTCSDEGQLL